MNITLNLNRLFAKFPLRGIGGLALALLITSCEKEEIKAVMNPNAAVVTTLSSQNVVLTKENADKDALTISWAKPDYGFNAAATYTILMDKKGGNFAEAAAFSTGGELKKTFKTSELNAALLKLGLKAGTAADLDVRVQAILGPTTTLSSALSSLKATPYLDKLDLKEAQHLVAGMAPTCLSINLTKPMCLWRMWLLKMAKSSSAKTTNGM
ncbi:MAG: SusE domain-containing protein [Spirosomaceae bacterium]|nr:SusE domain-containing protein [Spirosomataceae bacterium]